MQLRLCDVIYDFGPNFKVLTKHGLRRILRSLLLNKVRVAIVEL